MDGFNPAIAGARSMSLDGGYIGSIDHAIANLHIGRNQGINQGLEAGYQQGFQEGWDQGIAAGNVEIHKAMGFIRQHIAEKEQLQAALKQQIELTDQLAEKIRQLEAENALLRNELNAPGSTNLELGKLVDALKGANIRLQEQVGKLDSQLKERTAQYADQIWQYNRSLVFMNAVRGVLEELTSEKNPDSKIVKEMFAEKYTANVAESLAKNLIKCAPEQDEKFGKALPRTQQFIVNILNSVGKEPIPQLEQDDDEPWIP